MSRKLQPAQLVTHHFTLADVMAAYDTFADATRQHALKVIIRPHSQSDESSYLFCSRRPFRRCRASFPMRSYR